MPEFILWLVIYLLCGLWSTVAFQRHPWAWARTFTRDYWFTLTLAWPLYRFFIWHDWRDHDSNPNARASTDRIRDWLRSLGRDA